MRTTNSKMHESLPASSGDAARLEKRRRALRIVVPIILFTLPLAYMLKLYFGIALPFVALKDKSVLYAIVAFWNICLYYLLFRIF